VKPFGVCVRNWISNQRKRFAMIALFRTDYIRAFIIGFVVAGVPMAASTGLFS
jgi:hypothetical protein